MLKILGVLVLIIGSYSVGVYTKQASLENTGALTKEVEALTKMNHQLETRNHELQETLKLVKRQIQANRVVYQDFLEKLNSSDAERDEIRKQLEDQRILLQGLREKLADP